MTKIAIVGSRTFDDYNFLKAILYKHTKGIPNSYSIVSGGAKGADSLAKQYAEEFKIPIKEFLPDWATHGKSAGPIRNEQIVEECDIVIAFWDGISRGTKNTVWLATKAQKPVYVYWSSKTKPRKCINQ